MAIILLIIIVAIVAALLGIPWWVSLFLCVLFLD